MKKLGFIDLFIDEWHANNYPAWIKTARRGTEFELAYAWEKAPQNGRPLEKWCADFGVTPLKSMEEVVEKSDAVFVLAPSNPEVHRELAEIPLKSGKPVFVDKPFAPSKADAEAMFELAAKHNTPLMSSSALRFSTELDAYRNKPGTTYMETTGGGRSFWEYSIHQIEMIVSVLGTGAKRIMQCGANDVEHMVISLLQLTILRELSTILREEASSSIRILLLLRTASLRLSTSRASSAASEYILYRSNCYIEKITIFLLGAAYAAPFFLIFIWTI